MRLIDADKIRFSSSWSPAVNELFRGRIGREPTVLGWISVEDKLPEEVLPLRRGQKQLKVLVSDGRTVTSMLRMKGKWYDQRDVWSWGRRLDGGITHWMPLPEAPGNVK